MFIIMRQSCGLCGNLGGGGVFSQPAKRRLQRGCLVRVTAFQVRTILRDEDFYTCSYILKFLCSVFLGIFHA